MSDRAELIARLRLPGYPGGNAEVKEDMLVAAYNLETSAARIAELEEQIKTARLAGREDAAECMSTSNMLGWEWVAARIRALPDPAEGSK